MEESKEQLLHLAKELLLKESKQLVALSQAKQREEDEEAAQKD